MSISLQIIFFYLLIISLLLLTERVVVTGEDQIVFARVGEDVVLNCMVDSHIPPQRFDEVSWKKVDKSPDIIPVLLFQNGTIFSGSSHKIIDFALQSNN